MTCDNSMLYPNKSCVKADPTKLNDLFDTNAKGVTQITRFVQTLMNFAPVFLRAK